MVTSSPYDCIIIGGGPAGATAGTLLGQYGHRVCIVEKSNFPRHHVGESLVPGTYDTFKRLGMLGKLKASAFPVKQSVQFVNARGDDSQPFYFTDYDPAEHSYTWQVSRPEFDDMMLANARTHGAEILENTRVRTIRFDGDRAVGVTAVIDGVERDLNARVVLDASGQSAILSRQLDLRYTDDRIRNAAIYAYYKGAQRDEGRNAGATIIIYTPKHNGWFWYIPLSDDTTSVGVVAPPGYLTADRGNDPLATLQEEIMQCPGVARRLEGAELVSDAHVARDFAYRSRKLAGHGWVLTGDAFGFLDPVYSSGVLLALKSSEMAADSVHDALEAGDLSGERLGRFGPRLLSGMQIFRQMVYAFYEPDFSFGRFVSAYPQYRNHVIRILIGDVFNDEVGEIFQAMEDWVTLPGPIELEGGVRNT